jgi:hypothetical protein
MWTVLKGEWGSIFRVDESSSIDYGMTITMLPGI